MIGTSISGYRLVEKLGHGGFGYVYKGKHPRLPNRFVAVKLFMDNVESTKGRDIFTNEVRVLNQLHHPHILRILDCGMLEGNVGQMTPYLITDFASGGSLRDRINMLEDGHIISFEMTLRVLSQIGEALQYAHDKNVLHCDLKPENILFDENDQIVLADFGIAVVLTSVQTKYGIFVGTLQYMSPEQFSHTVSRESDQYSLACIAYELFTGRHPFQASDPSQWIYQHLHIIPKAPEMVNPDIPVAVGDVLLKGLAKEREERYQSVHEFIEALHYAYTHPYTRRLPRAKTRIITRTEARPKPRVYDIRESQSFHFDAPQYLSLDWNDDEWEESIYSFEDDDEPVLRREQAQSPFISERAMHPLRRIEKQSRSRRGYSRQEVVPRRKVTQSSPRLRQRVMPPLPLAPWEKYAYFSSRSVWWRFIFFSIFAIVYFVLTNVQNGFVHLLAFGVSLLYVGYTWFFFVQEMYDTKGIWTYCAIFLYAVNHF